MIDLDVVLVVEILAARQRVEVVRRAGSVGSGRPASTSFANGVIALEGITPSGRLAGQRIRDRLAENALPLRHRRDRREGHRLGDLAEPS